MRGSEDGPIAADARCTRRAGGIPRANRPLPPGAPVPLLQHLPPRQRAVLLLRDVLGFHAAEVADTLETSEDSVKSALRRARVTTERLFPASDRGRAPEANSPTEHELVRRFADAWMADDIDGVVALLTEDASFTMPPPPHEYHGRSAIY